MKRPNLRNFIYLVGSGCIIQLAGTFYRIWLAREIGPEGLGILQMVYPVYRLLSGLATIGLPLALTKWTAEYIAAREYAEMLALKNWAVRNVLLTSCLAGMLLFWAAPFVSHRIFSDPRVGNALLIIAFAIPFSALSAIYRGYFQGFSAMAPTAASEIIEQIAEVGCTVLGIIYLTALIPLPIFSYPVAGLTIGEVACLTTLLFFFKWKHPRYAAEKAEEAAGPSLVDTKSLKEPASPLPVLRYSWPLLLNQVVTSISFASEGVIIPHLLIAAGYSAHLSTGLFGKLTGMAEPVAYFPLIFLAPLGSVLSPQVSVAFKAKTLGKLRKKFALYYIACAVICLASFLLIFIGANPLARLLYQDASPVNLIRLLLFGLPFTGLAILNINILMAVGATDKILMISLWGTGLKTFAFFLFIPLFGISGAAWAINITQIFTLIASWVEVRRFLPWSGGLNCPRWLRPSRCRAELP